MNHLYWYSTSYNPNTLFSRIIIASKNFTLSEVRASLPNFKQMIFQNNNDFIQILLYESEMHGLTFLFVQQCEVKEKFIDHLQSKMFTGFHKDMFICDDEPHKMIAQIEASIKYFEEEEVLHIYGQQMGRDDAYIIGNRAALQRLRDQIDQALLYHEKKDIFSPNDQQGFDLYVACVEDDFDWEQLDEPYYNKKRKRPNEAFWHYKIEK